MWAIFQVPETRRSRTVSVVTRLTAFPLYVPVVRPSVAIQASGPSAPPDRRATVETTTRENAASAGR